MLYYLGRWRSQELLALKMDNQDRAESASNRYNAL
jgi:hypothetical protein